MGIAEYAAALEFCKASTTKRRLLDSLVLKSGATIGVREFFRRHSLLDVAIEDATSRHAEALRENPHVKHVAIDDAYYPDSLRKIPAPPAFLFYDGSLDVLGSRCIAVVGTRGASTQGLKLGEQLARDLATKDITVVSGMARGIDAAAHRGALKAIKGRTAAVVGTPLDRVYPAEHRDLQNQIVEEGVVVSQFPIGVPVSRYNFPERNRVMSGLCEATVVVEAGDTSGAVIQARQCVSQGRMLFVTPLVLANKELHWVKTYLERGAEVVDSAESILRILDQP